MASYSARLPQTREEYVQGAQWRARTPNRPKQPWEGSTRTANRPAGLRCI